MTGITTSDSVPQMSRTAGITNIFRAHFHSTLIAVRPILWVAGFLILIRWVSTIIAFNNETGRIVLAEFGHTGPTFSFLLPLLIAQLCWRGQSPGKRIYHLGLPVNRVVNTVTKVFSGLCIMLLIHFAYSILSDLMVVILRVQENFYWTHFLAPTFLLGLIILYLLVSGMVILLRRPWLTLALGGVVFLISYATLVASHIYWAKTAIDSVLFGQYGLFTTLSHAYVSRIFGFSDWPFFKSVPLTSYYIWTGISALIVIASAVDWKNTSIAQFSRRILKGA